MFIITVAGEIIANDKKHYAQNWACLCRSEIIYDNSFRYDEQQRRVASNLILNKRIRAVPYAAYVSEKNISACSTGDIACAPGAMAAILCYKDNISEIEELYNSIIPKETEDFFYNGLLTGIFSILELFLSDVLLCMIFSNNEVYNRTLDWLKQKKKCLDIVDPDLKIQFFFTNKIVYHRFDDVNCIFKNLLQISIPDTSQIQTFLHKRNNIAHRFAFSNIDRMGMTTIDLDMIKKLILYCNEFVGIIEKEIYSAYPNIIY